MIETENRIQCKRCKSYVRDIYNFCTYCGLKLKDVKVIVPDKEKIAIYLRKKYVISFFLSLKWKTKINALLISKFHYFLKKIDELCVNYDGFFEKFNHFEGGLVIFGYNEFERDLIFKVIDFSFKVEELIKKNFSDLCEYGIGICSGWAFFGEIESGNSMSITALGDCVNTSARLSTLFNNRKYVCVDIYETAMNFYEFEHMGKIKLKGKFDRIDVYTLISERKEIIYEEFQVPYIERSDVKGRLEAIIGEWEKGETKSVIITGEAGIGKTFLTENYLKKLKDKGFIIKLKGSDIYSNEPLYPFRLFIENSLNKEEFKFIKRYLETFLKSFSYFFERIEEKPNREKLKYLLFDLLRVICNKKGNLIIFFDDIDRTDPFTIEFINFLKSKIEKTLIILTGRVLPISLDPKNVYRINLRAFDYDETKELILKYFPDVSPEIILEIHPKTGGIPLFITQYLKSLKVRKKDIKEKPELPLSLISIVLSPIQELTEGERDLLEILSAVTELDLDSPLSEYFSHKIEKNLDKLILNDILRIENNRILFVNPLVREVIYESLPDLIKERIHKEIVDAVLDSPWAEENPYFVFINSLKAREYDKAWKYGIKSLKKLLREGTGFIPNFIFEKIDDEVIKNYKVKPLDMGDYFFLKGVYSFLAKDFEKSIQHFHKALLLTEEKDEKWNEINLYLSKSYIERGSLESAKKFLRDIKIKDEITSAKVNITWSFLYQKEGLFFDSLIFMRRASNELKKKGVFLSEFKLKLSDLLFWTGNLEDSLNTILDAEKSSYMEMNFENLIDVLKIKAFLGIFLRNENLFNSAFKIGLSFSQKFENLPYIFYFKNIKSLLEGNEATTLDLNLSFLRDPYIFFTIFLNTNEEFFKKIDIGEIEENPNFPFYQKFYIKAIKKIKESTRLSEDLKLLFEEIFKYPIPILHIIILRELLKICKKIERYDAVKFLLKNYIYIFEDLKNRIKSDVYRTGFEENPFFNPEKILKD
ncbi:MAG: AAA family ATPase [candidate division WOR-3 bacterium]